MIVLVKNDRLVRRVLAGLKVLTLPPLFRRPPPPLLICLRGHFVVRQIQEGAHRPIERLRGQD
jgi:hypothetical protein